MQQVTIGLKFDPRFLTSATLQFVEASPAGSSRQALYIELSSLTGLRSIGKLLRYVAFRNSVSHFGLIFSSMAKNLQSPDSPRLATRTRTAGFRNSDHVLRRGKNTVTETEKAFKSSHLCNG
jgi:hypothetical protein